MFRKTESKWIQSVNADIRAGAANERFVRETDLGADCSEGPESALAADDANGPNRTLAVPYNAAVQLSHCRHSSGAQHFSAINDRDMLGYTETGRASHDRGCTCSVLGEARRARK